MLLYILEKASIFRKVPLLRRLLLLEKYSGLKQDKAEQHQDTTIVRGERTWPFDTKSQIS